MNIRPKNIPKFLGGKNIWYNGLIDYDPSKYTYTYDTSKLVNGDMSDTILSPWKSNISGYDLGRYLPTTGYGPFGIGKEHYNYTKGVENLSYYLKFGNDLLDKDGNFTEVGKQWAKAVDALIPNSNHLARFYDDNGNLRTFWTTGHNDVHGRTPKTYNNLRDYVNAIRNDQILGARHNVFLNRGKRYFYIDNEGQKHWVDPSVIEKYNISETPSEQGWEGTTYWDDYELTGLLNKTSTPKNPKQGGQIPVGEKNDPESKWTALWNGLKAQGPNLLEGIRLAGNLINNERVYKASLEGIKPNLLQTYNTHRLIVGDEATKLSYYRRAALGITRASRPFTSDADKQQAYMMEAQRAANELKAQGDLADNAEIRRTSDESNLHLWGNTQRATEVANRNIIELNNAAAAKANLKAQKYTADWTNWDNFLQGVEYRARLKLLRKEAIDDLIWSLLAQELLENDNDYKTSLSNLEKVLKENDNDYNAPAVKEAINKRKEAYRKALIKIYKQNPLYGKSGIKISYKQKDDLLYKTARDTVEHFRKMSKMADDSRLKSRTKPIKLSLHPNKTRKMQQGGVAPFTIFKPVALGGESQIASSTNSDKNSSEKSNSGKETLDLVKTLFKEVLGLPIDVNTIYKNISNFLARSEAFGNELSTNDIASIYLQSMQQLNSVKHSKLLYEQAKNIATENGALGEFAVTAGGNYIVQDTETGKISEASLLQIKDLNLNPITNGQLLWLREFTPDLMFGNGDKFIDLAVNNAVGMEKIADRIKALMGSVGSSEQTIEGYTKHESNLIRKGFELLTEAPEGDYKYTQYTKELLQLMLHAYNYILAMLPNNMKAVLRINAYNQGITPDAIIKSLLNSNSSSVSRLEFDAVTGKAVKGNSKVGGDDGLKLDAPTALISGKGYLDNIEFNPGTSYAVTVNARHSGFQKKSGENMGSGITMQEATTSTLDQVLDWNKATLGGSRLNPTGYNRIMINNNDVVGVDLPVGSDKTQPDFSILKKLQLLDLELLKRGIEDTSNNWLQVNLICLEIGLPSKYKSDGHLNDYSWNRFAAFLVTADDSVLVNKDVILNDILGIVEDDNIRSLYEQIILKDNENYKLGSGFLGLGKQALYQGTVFVPIKSNYTAAALSGGLNITMSQATDLELRERGYDQSKAATYKPGMNLNEL